MKPLSRLFGTYLITLMMPMAILTSNEEVKTIVEINTELASNVMYVEEIIEKEPEIMFDNLTKDELIIKLNRILKHELANKGEVFVKYAIEYEVDPYTAVAIVLLETGCNSGKCSGLVTSCNNVGGQKTSGTNKCGTGSYAKFSSINSGIEAFFSNLSRNYIKKGLTTPEQMNKKYAESTSWASKVNYYIDWLKKA